MSISNWLAAATSKAMPVRGGEMGEEVLTRGQHIVVRSAEEIKRQTVTSKLSCFLFSSSRTGTFEFNSTTSCSRAPRRRAGRAAWPRRFADGRGRLAAVGAADDVFSADEFSEGDDAIGYQFRDSTRAVAWLITPGIRIFPAGSSRRARFCSHVREGRWPDQPRVRWCSRSSSGRPRCSSTGLLADGYLGTDGAGALRAPVIGALLAGWMAVRAKG
jgi:hypothetical protein